MVSQSSTVERRPPAVVMRLARLGAFHQSRLSFMRVLLRRLHRERWSFRRPVFQLDADGVGTAVYVAQGPERSYSLVAFGHGELPAEQRTDRIGAEGWDATFALIDGVPTAADLERLRTNVPRQETGRLSVKELCLARANRSVRLFDHVVDRLARGLQPEPSLVDETGYVMRTTAVYGFGKFGCADREAVVERDELAAPFQAEMLTVYLIRSFTLDLVEHLAGLRAPDTAAPLAPGLKRRLGVGNATGLGMVPFLINHPILLNNWIAAREEALARVRRVPHASERELRVFRKRLAQVRIATRIWRSDDANQARRVETLRRELEQLEGWASALTPGETQPWDRLYRQVEVTFSLEGQEQLVSLLMEPYGEALDELAASMSADEAPARTVDGTMRVGTLRDRIAADYGWALTVDFQAPEQTANLWYEAADTGEASLGRRIALASAYEQPWAPGRDVQALDNALANWPQDATAAAFVLRHPEHRRAVRRVQLLHRFPYAEIRDNLLATDVRPVDLLRTKLAFFGATRFDPCSDRSIRITMYQGAPLPDELAAGDADGWVYPAVAA